MRVNKSKGVVSMLVSIIVPVYKGNQYIDGIIEMAENNQIKLQTLGIDGKIELIFINDFPEIEIKSSKLSESRTIEMCVYNNTRNEGIHKSRINGLKHSKGKYILFLDQDDLISDKCIASQLQSIKEADIVIGNGYKATGDCKKLIYRNIKKQKLAASVKTYLYAANQIVSPGHCLILKTAIPQEWFSHIVKVNGGDDLFLWLLMFAYGKKVIINSELIYTHMETGTNVSGSTIAMINTAKNVITLSRKCESIPSKWVDIYERRIQLTESLVGRQRIKKLFAIIKNMDLCVYKLFAYCR